MALTQTARMPGPSWDEEVVPALRKRLEDESRTIARRLSSLEDASRPYLNGNKPTRIPKVARTPSVNLTVATPPDNSSHSTISVHSPQSSGLLHEQPPFASQQSSNDDLPPPRPSNDSEEHPFEHWYRGEVSRNGGVGELRVAKRKEMLDIANYGHPTKSPVTRNAITEAIEQRRVQRKRADSLGVRGSIYMDEERARQIAAVMDEAPLTDFDGEGSDSGNGSDYYDQYSHAMRMEKSIPRNTTPTPSNIPRPASRQRTVSSQRATTPTPTSRGMSEPPTQARARSPQQRSASANSTQSSQKRGPSPITTPAKKSRTAASKATRAKLEAARNKEENRKSVVSYPTPDDDMEGAIPQWTQPVPVDGNWDNVVLPAVARKQGLNGYQTMDGSPKPKQPGNVEHGPAPGTFGYDHTKYRPARGGGDEFIPIQMDEFGRPAKIVEEDINTPSGPLISTPYDEIRVGPRPHPPPSPVPFSSYAPNNSSGGPQPVSGNATKSEVDDVREDEGGAGCCKCVVM